MLNPISQSIPIGNEFCDLRDDGHGIIVTGISGSLVKKIPMDSIEGKIILGLTVGDLNCYSCAKGFAEYCEDCRHCEEGCCY